MIRIINYIWREDPLNPLLVYRLTTVVFGFSSSQFLAFITLKQLITDVGKNYPLAAEMVNKQIYVDDLIRTADNLETAISLQKEAIELLSKGGFELRKWTITCPKLYRSLTEKNLSLHLCGTTDIQFVEFCDGSVAGYGAVVYIQCVTADGNIKMSLLIAKFV